VTPSDPLARLVEGDVAGAQAALVRLADEAAARGDHDRAVRARASAAGLSRATGDLDGAEAHLRAASSSCGPDAAAARALEYAELALARGDLVSAAYHAERARGLAEDDHLVARLQRFGPRLEVAERCLATRPQADAMPSVDHLMAGVDEPYAEALRRLMHAVGTGDASLMAPAADELRRASLEAVSPEGYLFAAFVASLAADARGDRLTAYTSLATALVTLSDLLGREPAVAVVEPALHYLLDNWGEEEFFGVKARHDELARQRRSGAPA
jgi:hypothetical protein